MIDTGHLGAPPDNTEKTFDAVPLRTHSLTLASKALASKALPEVQVDLAHVDSIRTRGRLAASVAPEVTQSIAAIVANAQAARHFLDLQPPVLDEVRQALDCIVRDAYRASDVIYRIRRLFKEGAAEEGAREDQWSDPRRARADASPGDEKRRIGPDAPRRALADCPSRSGATTASNPQFDCTARSDRRRTGRRRAQRF
jgi:hypothetical protein